MSAKILLVEDDPTLGYVIKDGLAHKGYEVTLCKDGEQGQSFFEQQLFDLCIFDVMMPKKDGFTLAKAIRDKNTQVPILFVTAKTMLEDKMDGFRAGGEHTGRGDEAGSKRAALENVTSGPDALDHHNSSWLSG